MATRMIYTSLPESENVCTNIANNKSIHAPMLLIGLLRLVKYHLVYIPLGFGPHRLASFFGIEKTVNGCHPVHARKSALAV